MSYKLFTYRNEKTLKGEGMGYMSLILHLAPANKSGYNTCPYSTPGCRAACLATSGHMRYSRVQDVQVRRTLLWFENPEEFKRLAIADINILIRRAAKNGKKPAVRLNGTSDLDWPKLWPELFTMFPQVQFYDYCKGKDRVLRKNPPNYHLTFSRCENTHPRTVKSLVGKGVNVAVVFDTLPKKYLGLPVVVGDNSDLRFLDKKGIVGLTPKGRGKKDTSGFVVRT